MNGMQQQAVRANGVRFNVWVGGEGPPVVLLHGYPESALMWRKIVPQLLPNHTAVCPDLRGYAILTSCATATTSAPWRSKFTGGRCPARISSPKRRRRRCSLNCCRFCNGYPE